MKIMCRGPRPTTTLAKPELACAAAIALCAPTLAAAAPHHQVVAPGFEPLAAGVSAFFGEAGSFEPHAAGGCVIVVRARERVLETCAGAANREFDVPWTLDTRFFVASITKSMVAQVVLLLADEGKVDLDAPVTTYLPDFPRFDPPVLVRHLLNMSSGLRQDESSLWLSGNNLYVADYGYQIDLAAQHAFTVRQREPSFVVGSYQTYLDVNYRELALLIEAVTGGTFAEAVGAYVAGPLGLEGTSVAPDFLTMFPDMASPYWTTGQHPGGARRLEIPFAPSGDGSVISTPNDVAAWAEALVHGHEGWGPFLDRMRPSEALSPGLTHAPWYGYGMGDEGSPYGLTLVGHGGYFGTQYAYSPELDLLLVYFTNDWAIDTDALMEAIVTGVLQSDAAAGAAWLGNPVSPQAEVMATRTPEDNAKLTGIFINRETGYVLRSLDGEPGEPVSHDLLGADFDAAPLGEGRFADPFGPTLALTRNPAEPDLLVSGAGWTGELLFERVEPLAADAVPTEALIGKYFSDEWQALFQVKETSDGLILQRGGGLTADEVLTMTPLASDIFMLTLTPEALARDGDWFMASAKFEGDAMTFSYADARDVRFERLSD